MATASGTCEIANPLTQPAAWPTFESMEDAVRAARHAVKNARRWSDDVVAGTAREVRRRPLVAVGIATTAGLLAGCAFGLAAAWVWRRRGSGPI